MKIILFGKTGMLGARFDEVLSRRDDVELKSFDRKSLDVTDEKALFGVVGAFEPEIIVNCTGYTAVDDCEENPELAMRLNAEAVGLIAAACKSVGAKLIHFSTDYVFDGTKFIGYREDDEPGPVNVYGESKLAGEKAILEAKCDFYIVRTAWLYGRYGNNFVETMISLSKKKDCLQVVGDQFGSPTYVDDLCDKVLADFVFGEEEFVSGIYHVTNMGACSWYEFAGEIFKQLEVKVDLQRIGSDDLGRKAKRPAYGILLNSKLMSMRPWQKALKAYFASKEF